MTYDKDIERKLTMFVGRPLVVVDTHNVGTHNTVTIDSGV